MMGSNLGEQEAKWDHARFGGRSHRRVQCSRDRDMEKSSADGSLAWQRRQSHNVVRFAESWSAHLAMPRQLNASSNLFVRPSIAIMLAANPRSNTNDVPCDFPSKAIVEIEQ